MTGRADPTDNGNLSDLIRTRHPGISIELQIAINTLRKLQEITGDVVPEPIPGPAKLDPLTMDAADPTMPPASERDAPSADFVTQDFVLPQSSRQLPVLAERESFGRYQIIRLLGRGAMGAVYLAFDAELERHVALKTPFFGDDPTTVQRFYREARAAARLRSPYICTIYDVGQVGDTHYFTMEFVEGESLRQCIRNERFRSLTEAGRIVAKIARGVHKAHAQSIIHRDLKPDNVMIDADGEPIVMDFGLAREIDNRVALTRPGAIIGTPAYMSPEQVEGDQHGLGPATDIYSLGVILFEMLTGNPPFRGSLMSVLQQIGRDAPPRPSALAPDIPADSPLEQICLKMIAKSPIDRFASMEEVAEAVESRAQPPPSLDPVVPWRKRVWSALTRSWA